MPSATTKTKKVLAVLLAGMLLLCAASSVGVDDKHLSIYSPVAVYTLPVMDRAGHEYVGLLELLEPLGRVSSQAEGKRWRLRFNAVDAEFTVGMTRARIHGREFDFGTPFLIENSRGLVPLNSLPALLPRFLGAPIDFHGSARRLFVGGVAIQTSFRLDAGNPPRLLLNFSAPVNPTIATLPNKLRMVFTRDAIISPGSQSISFDNKVITHASYSESDGNAELEITANQPLIATFSGDRKTITVSAVSSSSTPSSAAPSSAVPPAAVAPSAAATLPRNPSPGNSAQSNPTQARPVASGSSANPHRPVAVVDPAHGGDERGAALTEKLAEKDVTLEFGRLLRHELEIRGFAVTLLREGDINSTLDQRAAAANGAQAAIYISVHAASQGSGVGVYTALVPVEGVSQGVFHAWNAAQAPVLPVSHVVSDAVVAEMRKREFPVHAAAASLRPLNNVVMPAIAVELEPGPNGIDDLTSANYQQRTAAAIAEGVASIHDRLEHDRLEGNRLEPQP